MISVWIETGLKDVKENVRILIDGEPLTCEICSERIVFNSQNLYSFYDEGSVTCHKCSHKIDLLVMSSQENDIDDIKT